MQTVALATVLISAMFVATETAGQSCEEQPTPKMGEVIRCCNVDSKETTPKVKEMQNSGKSCYEAYKNEYKGLSEDEIKQKGGENFGEYKCMIECVYKNIGVLSQDGSVDKSKFLEMTTESFSEEFQAPATAAVTKCLEKMNGIDLCAKTGGIIQLSKCFMAEMVLTCPAKHFNDTETCRNARAYLTNCEDVFSQSQ